LKHVKDWRSVYVYDLWVKYFSAYDEGDPVSVEVQKEAHNYIVSVIKDSEIIRTDLLLESYAVRSLKMSQYKMTYILLEIFTTKGYKDFIDFQKKNSRFVEGLGLNQSDLVSKIRLLTFTSLAAAQNVISYSEVAQLLSIDESEVEPVVVDAITSDILDARLDQLNRRIVVRHAESRVFSRGRMVPTRHKTTKMERKHDQPPQGYPNCQKCRWGIHVICTKFKK